MFIYSRQIYNNYNIIIHVKHIGFKTTLLVWRHGVVFSFVNVIHVYNIKVLNLILQ